MNPFLKKDLIFSSLYATIATDKKDQTDLFGKKYKREKLCRRTGFNKAFSFTPQAIEGVSRVLFI